MTKFIELIGSPAAGKSTLSREFYQKLSSRNIKSNLFSPQAISLDKLKKPLTLSDNLLSLLIVCLIAIYTLCVIRTDASRLRKPKEWIKWLNRLQNELMNSISCRRYILHRDFDHDVIISDARVLGRYLFEIADPRNIIGIKLLTIILLSLRLLPKIDIHHLFIIVADSKDAMNRESIREINRVRSFLPHSQRVEFFKKAEELSYKLYRSFPYCKNISMINTSNVKVGEACDNMLSQIVL